MKTLSRIFTTLFVALIGLNAFAADGTTVYSKIANEEADNFAYSIYSVKNAEKIKFSFEKLQDVKVSVKIYDEDYDLLFTDIVSNQEEGSINYNFSELGQGIYHVKVSAKGFDKTHSFSVGEESFTQKFTPYLSSVLDNEKVHVSFQNASSPVTLKVYDNDGIIYHDELITDNSYSSYINLSELDAGNYTVEIINGGKSTTKAVTIQ